MKNKILSDKGTHYFVQTAPIMPGGKPRRHKIRRFLCIGGPRDTEWRSGEELADENLGRGEYYAFNSAGSAAHSSVFIHRSIVA